MVDYIRDNFAVWAKYQNRPMSEGWERFAERTVGVDDSGNVVYKNNEASQVEDDVGAAKDLYQYDNSFGGITFGDTGVPTRIHADEWYNLVSYDGSDLRSILSYAGAASVDNSVAYYSTSAGEWVLGDINAMHDHDDIYVNTSGGDTMQGNLVVETNNIVISGGALQVGVGGGVHDIEYGTGLANFNKSGTSAGGVSSGYGGKGYMLESSNSNNWVVAQAVADLKLSIGATEWTSITLRTSSYGFSVYYNLNSAYRTAEIAPTSGWSGFGTAEQGRLLAWDGNEFTTEDQRQVVFSDDHNMENGKFLRGMNVAGDAWYNLIGIAVGTTDIEIGNSTDRRQLSIYGPGAGSVRFDGTSIRLDNTFKYIIEAADESAVVVLEITSGDVLNIGEATQRLDTTLNFDDLTLNSAAISTGITSNTGIQFSNFKGIHGTETGSPFSSYTLIRGYNDTVDVGDYLHNYPLYLRGSAARPQYDGGSGLVDLALLSDAGGGGGSDTDAIHVNLANEITGITAITGIAGLDEFVLEDQSDSFNKKAVTWTTIQSELESDLGGPWLPLTAGSGEPLTGNLHIERSADPTLILAEGGSATDFCSIIHDGQITHIRNTTGTGIDSLIYLSPRVVNVGDDCYLRFFGSPPVAANQNYMQWYAPDGSEKFRWLGTSGDVQMMGGRFFMTDPANPTIYLQEGSVGNSFLMLQDTGGWGYVRKWEATGAATLAFGADPMDNTSSSSVHIGYATNTTGSRVFTLYDGSAAKNVQHMFNMGDGNVTLCQQAGNLAVKKGNIYIDADVYPSLNIRQGESATQYFNLFNDNTWTYIRGYSDTQAAMLIEPIVGSTDYGHVYFMRNTNTSGSKLIRFYVGSGAATTQHQLNCGTGDADFCIVGGQLSEAGNDVFTEGANEFPALQNIATILGTDLFLFEDASASYAKRKVSATNLATSLATIMGGPYLPLSAGSSVPLTDILYMDYGGGVTMKNSTAAYRDIFAMSVNTIVVGDASSPLELYGTGPDKWIVSGTLAITATTLTLTGNLAVTGNLEVNVLDEYSGGYIDVQTGFYLATYEYLGFREVGGTRRAWASMQTNNNIEVGSSTNPTVFTDPLSLKNAIALKGYNSGYTTSYDMIKINSSSQIIVGNSSTYTYLESFGAVRMLTSIDMLGYDIEMGVGGQVNLTNNYGIQVKETGGTERTALKMNTSNDMYFGAATNDTVVRGLTTKCQGIKTGTTNPTTAHFGTGQWGAYRNTSGNTTWMVANYGGVIYKFQLT